MEPHPYTIDADPYFAAAFFGFLIVIGLFCCIFDYQGAPKRKRNRNSRHNRAYAFEYH